MGQLLLQPPASGVIFRKLPVAPALSRRRPLRSVAQAGNQFARDEHLLIYFHLHSGPPGTISGACYCLVPTAGAAPPLRQPVSFLLHASFTFTVAKVSSSWPNWQRVPPGLLSMSAASGSGCFQPSPGLHSSWPNSLRPAVAASCPPAGPGPAYPAR
jgi:hypothetical protein